MAQPLLCVATELLHCNKPPFSGAEMAWQGKQEDQEMFNQVNKLANQTINQAMIVADTVVGVSRAAAEGTAQMMFKAKKPLRDVAKKGVRLNRISHNSVEKLVKVQAKALERSVDAGAARLELAARAPTFRALIDEQVSLLPETRKRLTGDLRNTWEIFVEAGSEIGSTLRPRKATASKRSKGAAKTTAKKTAKTTARKTSKANSKRKPVKRTAKTRATKKRVAKSKAATAKSTARRVTKTASGKARKAA